MLYGSQQDDEAEKMYTAFEKATEGWEQGPSGGVPHPLLVPTLCNHGALLERVKGDLDGAEALYKKALLIKPEDSATLYNYAVGNRCPPTPPARHRLDDCLSVREQFSRSTQAGNHHCIYLITKKESMDMADDDQHSPALK